MAWRGALRMGGRKGGGGCRRGGKKVLRARGGREEVLSEGGGGGGSGRCAIKPRNLAVTSPKWTKTSHFHLPETASIPTKPVPINIPGKIEKTHLVSESTLGDIPAGPRQSPRFTQPPKRTHTLNNHRLAHLPSPERTFTHTNATSNHKNPSPPTSRYPYTSTPLQHRREGGAGDARETDAPPMT